MKHTETRWAIEYGMPKRSLCGKCFFPNPQRSDPKIQTWGSRQRVRLALEIIKDTCGLLKPRIVRVTITVETKEA